ncbi:MAG: type II 3-dehydroquinate dehydratase [Rhizobiaceae bacterium]
MSKPIFVLNGPNLNLLGTREPEHYGSVSIGDIEKMCADAAGKLGMQVDFRQTNHEGTLVDWIQEAGSNASAIVLNPAAYGHTSIAMYDAISAISIPVAEVHVSNIYAREEFRHKTLVSQVASGTICGFGAHGYTLAIQAVVEIVNR